MKKININCRYLGKVPKTNIFYSQFKEILKQCGYNEESIKEILETLDIVINENISKYQSGSKGINPDFKEKFEEIDPVSLQNLKNALNDPFVKEIAEDYLGSAMFSHNTDIFKKDGKIDVSSLMDYINNHILRLEKFFLFSTKDSLINILSLSKSHYIEQLKKIIPGVQDIMPLFEFKYRKRFSSAGLIKINGFWSPFMGSEVYTQKSSRPDVYMDIKSDNPRDFHNMQLKNKTLSGNFKGESFLFHFYF